MKRPALLPVWFALLIGAGLIAFAACDDNGGDDSGALTPPAATQPADGLPPGEPSTTVRAEATRGPVEGPGAGEPPATLVDVRTEAQDGADRIIFQFEGARPPYAITYTPPPITECGSGEQADVVGNAFLVVRFGQANAHNEAGEPTIAAQEFAPALPSLVEAQLTCDFEADVTWALGVAQEVDFTVIEQENPFALIIDLSHP